MSTSPINHDEDSPGVRDRGESSRQSVTLLLAAGKSITAAAEAAGIHRSTIHHWLAADPAFAAAVESARSEYLETLRDKLRDQAALALDTLTELLTRPDTPPSVRLRAALAVLQRPQFPNPGWNLPEPVETEEQRRLSRQLAMVDADYDIIRKSRALQKDQLLSLRAAAGAGRQNSTLFDTLSVSVPPASQPARNSLCPCGSGKKYKRCCGHNAPPRLSALPFAV